MKDQYFNVDMSYRNDREAVVRTHVHFLDKQPDMVVKCEVWNEDSHCMEYHFSDRLGETHCGMSEKTFPVAKENRFTANAAVIWLDGAGRLNLHDSKRDLPVRQEETISATVSVTKPRAKNGRETQVYYYRGGICDYSYPENRMRYGTFDVRMPFAGTVTVDSEEWEIVEIADGTVPQYPAPEIKMFLKAGGSVDYERPIIPQLRILDKKHISWDLYDYWNCMFESKSVSPNFVMDFYGKFYIRLQNAADPDLYRFEGILITSMEYSAGEQEKLIRIEPIRISYGCMAKDTRILMADGNEKVISEIVSGDMVMTNQGPAAVRDVITGMEQTLIHITAEDGSTVRLTDQHPVLTDRGYVRACRLLAGDVLILHGDVRQSLSALYIEEYHDKVYSLDTSAPGTALVGNGFWVGDFKMQNSPCGKEEIQEPVLPWMKEAKEAFGRLADCIESSSLEEIKNAFYAAGAYTGDSGADKVSDTAVLSVDGNKIEKIVELLA